MALWLEKCPQKLGSIKLNNNRRYLKYTGFCRDHICISEQLQNLKTKTMLNNQWLNQYPPNLMFYIMLKIVHFSEKNTSLQRA